MPHLSTVAIACRSVSPGFAGERTVMLTIGNDRNDLPSRLGRSPDQLIRYRTESAGLLARFRSRPKKSSTDEMMSGKLAWPVLTSQ
jgi:hypothetical protein